MLDRMTPARLLLGTMLALILIAVVLAFFAGPAAAQDTTIGFDEVLAPLRPYIVELLGFLIIAFMSWLTSWLRTRFKIELDAKYRLALHAALENGARLAMSKLDRSVAGRDLDIRNPLIAEGIDYVLKYSPAAVEHFGLTPAALGEMLRAKFVPATAERK